MKIITKEYLESLNACKSQVELFNRVFPKGARVNIWNLWKAKRNKIDYIWLVIKLFIDKYHTDTKPLWDKYNTDTKLLSDKYEADIKLFKSPWACVKELRMR